VKLAALVALCCLGLAAPAAAQNPVLPPPAPVSTQDSADAVRDSIIRNRVRGDSIRPRPPISPSTAFFRSLAVPGWGQMSLQRNVTGGIFVAFEGIALTMLWKSNWQLDYARVRQKYVKSHEQERQDWIALLVFNHLISGAEAFVSAHLYDFPASLHARPLPAGGTGVGVTVPF
jgi:hypothetical protein